MIARVDPFDIYSPWLIFIGLAKKIQNRSMRKARSLVGKFSKNRLNIEPNLDEDIVDLSMLDFKGMKDVRASTYPCNDLLIALGICKTFYELVNNAGLLDFTINEVDQYRRLTYIFVQTFKFHDDDNPYVEFCLYDRKRRMYLDEFCRALGVTNQGYAGRIETSVDLISLYSNLCHQSKKAKKHSKISCMQFPVVRYFAYYLARGVLARENTSTSTNLDLAIMLAAVDKDYSYSIGAQIARRIDNNAGRGRTYGGIVASRILFSQTEVPLDPSDELLPPRRLDFHAMMNHSFFNLNCSPGDYRYKLLFEAGDNAPRYVRLPGPSLFDVSRHGWSFSQDILDEYLRPAFPVNPVTQEEEHTEEPSAPPPSTYTGEPSSFNYGEGSSSQ